MKDFNKKNSTELNLTKAGLSHENAEFILSFFGCGSKATIWLGSCVVMSRSSGYANFIQHNKIINWFRLYASGVNLIYSLSLPLVLSTPNVFESFPYDIPTMTAFIWLSPWMMDSWFQDFRCVFQVFPINSSVVLICFLGLIPILLIPCCNRKKWNKIVVLHDSGQINHEVGSNEPVHITKLHGGSFDKIRPTNN